MMVALELILGAVTLLFAAGYLWAWLQAVGELVWLAILRTSLTLLTLLALFAMMAFALAWAFDAGPWTIVACAIAVLPVLGRWAINILAWNLARRSFTRAGTVLTSQPNGDRPLARWPDVLSPERARALRRSKMWMSLRRATWAAPLFAIQQRQSEQSATYERPPVEDGLEALAETASNDGGTPVANAT